MMEPLTNQVISVTPLFSVVHTMVPDSTVTYQT